MVSRKARREIEALEAEERAKAQAKSQKPDPLSAVVALLAIAGFFFVLLIPRLFLFEPLTRWFINVFGGGDGRGAPLAHLSVLAAGSLGVASLAFLLTKKGLWGRKILASAFVLAALVASLAGASGRGSVGRKRRDEIDTFVLANGGTDALSELIQWSFLLLMLSLLVVGATAAFSAVLPKPLRTLAPVVVLCSFWIAMAMVFIPSSGEGKPAKFSPFGPEMVQAFEDNSKDGVVMTFAVNGRSPEIAIRRPAVGSCDEAAAEHFVFTPAFKDCSGATVVEASVAGSEEIIGRCVFLDFSNVVAPQESMLKGLELKDEAFPNRASVKLENRLWVVCGEPSNAAAEESVVRNMIVLPRAV